jgi:cytochrome c-type biogenesis protein CcmH/NrfG
MPAAHVKIDKWNLVTGAVLVALVWSVFGQTVRFGFVNYDDPLYILQNPTVRSGLSWHGVAWAFTHIHSQNWHPLTSISHMLDCQLFGLNAGAYHFVNVLLHSIVAVVLFFALNKMTANVWRSAFATALFAIHPLRVESVAWIAERKDVLSGVFFAGTLAAYAWYARQPTKLRYLLALLLFAFGLMSKPMLVTLPIILLLVDYWPLRRFNKSPHSLRRLWIEKIPFVLLSGASCVATLVVQNLALGTTANLPLRWRIANALVSYIEYLRQFVWPVRLSPFYIHPENRLPGWQIASACILLLAISALAIQQRRKRPYLIVGWFWYVVMLLPVIGLVQVGLQGHADRYTYLPHIGLCLAITWAVGDLLGQRRARFLCASAGVIVGLALLAWRQTSYWRDTQSLWRHALAIEPNSDVAQAGLAGILLTRGQTDEAIEHYERAIVLRPGNAAAHHGLATAFANEHRTDEAIAHWQKSLSILPNNIEALNHLAIALVKKGQVREAVPQWEKALAYEPDDPDATNNLAWVLATSPEADVRNGPRAVQLAERAVQLTHGADPTRLLTLAAAYAEAGQFLAAVPTANKGLELAEANGNTALADHLRYCADLFFRRIPLRETPPAR